MSWNQIELRSSSYTNASTSSYHRINTTQKPIEIYAFVDPLCPDCWSLEPYLKKLSIEYGRYFNIRPIISRHLSVLTNDHLKTLKRIWNKSSSNIHLHMNASTKNNNLILFPWIALAIKAAELQGKSAGRKFLRKIQGKFFLKGKNIASEGVLMQCAEDANLDIEEFKSDLFSVSAKKAYQCDLKITKDMGVNSSPTLVIFNQMTDEQGIKIPGTYTYDTYVHILKGLLGNDIEPTEKTPLKDFLAFYGTVPTYEVATVYDWTEAKTVQELKKLQIKRKVVEIKNRHHTFWQYVQEDASL